MEIIEHLTKPDKIEKEMNKFLRILSFMFAKMGVVNTIYMIFVILIYNIGMVNLTIATSIFGVVLNVGTNSIVKSYQDKIDKKNKDIKQLEFLNNKLTLSNHEYRIKNEMIKKNEGEK